MTFYRGIRRPFVEGRNDAVAINWRRGFFRVWLLLSAAWIMSWAIYLILRALGDGFHTTEYLMIPVVFFGPPVAVLILGVSAAWAFRGFRTDDSPASEPNTARMQAGGRRPTLPG